MHAYNTKYESSLTIVAAFCWKGYRHCLLPISVRLYCFFEHESFLKMDSFKDRHITTSHPNSDILISLLSVFFLCFPLLVLLFPSLQIKSMSTNLTSCLEAGSGRTQQAISVPVKGELPLQLQQLFHGLFVCVFSLCKYDVLKEFVL